MISSSPKIGWQLAFAALLSRLAFQNEETRAGGQPRVKEYFRIRSLRFDLATHPQRAATTAEARAVRGDCHFVRGLSIRPAAGGVKRSAAARGKDQQAHEPSRRTGSGDRLYRDAASGDFKTGSCARFLPQIYFAAALIL
jgi:hypothetical protein